MGLLEEGRADLLGLDVRGDRQHRGTAALGVVQALHQVGVAGATAARAYREPSGDLCLRGGGERAALLVADVHPLDALGAADGVDDRVEAVARYPVDPAGPGLPGHVDELLGARAMGPGAA